ncbi:protein ALTERED XYLOGLUCAN 9-like [Wolffia australiana]
MARRRQLLFLGLAVLIALAVSSTPSLRQGRDRACGALLNAVVWAADRRSWAWSSQARACGYRKRTGDLLRGARILVAGDSQARLFALAMLGLVLEPPALEAARSGLAKRHSDYAAADRATGTRLDFAWAPYEANLTGLAGGGADVVVMGSGLWHMLHVGDAGEYGRGLAAVGAAVKGGRLFWLGLARVVKGRLGTEEKRERMGGEAWEAYERAARGSGLLREEGGPFVLVDLGGLTAGCGEACAEDGLHYVEGVYEAAVQVLLNSLAADGFSPRH